MVHGTAREQGTDLQRSLPGWSHRGASSLLITGPDIVSRFSARKNSNTAPYNGQPQGCHKPKRRIAIMKCWYILLTPGNYSFFKLK